jgi:hypothetical protein
MADKHSAMLVVAISALLGLSACNPNTSETNAAPTVVATPSDAGAVANKRKVYVEAYNDLIDPGIGVNYVAMAYGELNIPQADPAAAISFPVYLNVSVAIDRLKEGRALPGTAMAAADAAADKLIATLQTLVTQLQALEPYYKARAYRDDALAKGKAAHEPLLKAMDEAQAALGDLDVALREQERTLNAARIEALRKGGFEGEANLVATMQAGEAFVQAVIAGDAAAADRLAAPLKAAATALAGSEAKGADAGINKTKFSMVAGNGTSMIGAWRDYKASKSDTDRERVIAEYNSAVLATEYMQLPTP